jgi:hypothetical protein
MLTGIERADEKGSAGKPFGQLPSLFQNAVLPYKRLNLTQVISYS